MSDFDRMMARTYCKVLRCVDPDHELLTYQIIVHLPYVWLGRGGPYESMHQAFIQRFTSHETGIPDRANRSWFNRNSIPAYRNFYKALYQALQEKDVDIWSRFWLYFQDDLDALGRLRSFAGSKIRGNKANPPLVWDSLLEAYKERVEERPFDLFSKRSYPDWSDDFASLEDEPEEESALESGNYFPADPEEHFLVTVDREQPRHFYHLKLDLTDRAFRKALRKSCKPQETPQEKRRRIRDHRDVWIELE